MNAHRPDPPAAAADVEVRGSLIRRLFLSSLLWVVATLLAGGFVLTFAFADYVQKKFEADLMRRLDALIGAAEVDELFDRLPRDDEALARFPAAVAASGS